MSENTFKQAEKKIEFIIYDKEDMKCKGKFIVVDTKFTIDDFTIFIVDNGGIQVFMPKNFMTIWPYSNIISWKDVQQQFKNVVKQAYSETSPELAKIWTEAQQIEIQLSALQNDKSCFATVRFFDGKTVNGFIIKPTHTENLQILMPKGFGSVWRLDKYISWRDMQIMLKNKYNNLYPNKKKPNKPKAHNIGNITVKFHDIDKNGTCLANCIFKNENIQINNFIIHFKDNPFTVDMPSDLDEWIIKSVPFEVFKIFLIEKLHSFFKKMNINPNRIQELNDTKNNEFWINKGEHIMQATNDTEKSTTNLDWRRVLGEHNSISGVSPLVFVPNTVLRVEQYIEKHEQIKSNKKTLSNNNIPVDLLVSALTQNDFISDFELDVLTWINRLRYVTTTMLMDLYISGYIAPTSRKITKDKFAKTVNRMQKYNLVSVTRFASFDDVSQIFDSKSANRIYTLEKNGFLILKELGRDAEYIALDKYQDGNIVKGYMAANQHLIRWLSAYPSYIKNNYETNHVVRSIGSKKIGARLGGLVRCGENTVIIEAVRRTDRWTYDENCQFSRDKLTRIIKLIEDHDNLYHRSTLGGSEVKYELGENPIICYTCEDEEHMHEIWSIIKPIAIANPNQRIWFTHDLNIYNDSAEGMRYVEFSEDDTYKIVDVQKLFNLGKEREYDFLYSNHQSDNNTNT